MILETVKIQKMGPKLGLYFSKFHFPKGKLVEINVSKENRSKIFLTKFNRLIVLRKNIVNYLRLKSGDKINLDINEKNNLNRSKEFLLNEKIDMLALIPESTSKNYKIFATGFKKKNEEWLRIWYSHERGSGKQVEIRRYANIEILGSMLGQYQAEGTKFKNTDNKISVEFVNKLINENKEFFDSLMSLGISKNMVKFKYIYNPKKISRQTVNKHLNEFNEKFNFPIDIYKNNSKGYGFVSTVRSVLLSEIIINCMNSIREFLSSNPIISGNHKKLAESFFAKLLCGDGTLDVRCNRRKFPDLKIKIVDCDKKHLQDYSRLMENLGFKARIYEQYINVCSSCSFLNLIKLYNINAFENTINRNKLIVAIALMFRGRRIKTYLRFLDLISKESYSAVYISKKYEVSYQAAHDWLNNKMREGFIERIDSSLWRFTDKGKELVHSLICWRKNYENLVKKKEIEDPSALLESLKIKKMSKKINKSGQ
ncbi:hypothetical protein ISS07_03155 [Candidatus Woesearchaeota archaeon]|nr:hypothetical protein [Candidatus Woesearchaeota archaeon]